jgi:hypothetical protein
MPDKKKENVHHQSVMEGHGSTCSDQGRFSWSCGHPDPPNHEPLCDAGFSLTTCPCVETPMNFLERILVKLTRETASGGTCKVGAVSITVRYCSDLWEWEYGGRTFWDVHDLAEAIIQDSKAHSATPLALPRKARASALLPCRKGPSLQRNFAVTKLLVRASRPEHPRGEGEGNDGLRPTNGPWPIALSRFPWATETWNESSWGSMPVGRTPGDPRWSLDALMPGSDPD